MISIIIIMMTSLITENVVFNQSLGICAFLGVSKKTSSAVGMGLAVTLVIVLSSMLAWVINTFLLVPLDIEYLRVVVFILVISGLVQLLDILLKRFVPALYNSLGIYLALITTNCAVLGTALNVISLSLVSTFFTGLFTGLGFLLALVIMAGVRERMEIIKIPRFFKGFAVTLIAAAIMALAFSGFANFSFVI